MPFDAQFTMNFNWVLKILSRRVNMRVSLDLEMDAKLLDRNLRGFRLSCDLKAIWEQ
jgi:hypothetical protein